MGNGSKGFTLIELVTTVVAVSVLAISLAPIDSFQRFNLEMAAQRVEQEIRFAKELASTVNVNHGINFVAYSDYTVYRESIDNPVTNPLTKAPLITNISEEFKNVTIPNSGQIEFDPTGQLVIETDFIRLETADTQYQIYIQINPVTGAISRVVW